MRLELAVHEAALPKVKRLQVREHQGRGGGGCVEDSISKLR